MSVKLTAKWSNLASDSEFEFDLHHNHYIINSHHIFLSSCVRHIKLVIFIFAWFGNTCVELFYSYHSKTGIFIIHALLIDWEEYVPKGVLKGVATLVGVCKLKLKIKIM